MTPPSSAIATDLLTLSAAELLRGYQERRFSPVEVTAQLLDAVEHLNPSLRAFLSIDEEEARRQAKEAEDRWLSPDSVPPLCGVPVSVKDTIEVAGMPTTYGSLPFRSHAAPDSLIGSTLRRAGAIIFGKTNTSEFALAIHTVNRLGAPATNPWDTTRSAGGSSGGAGSAVAAGLGPIAVGTDSAGSVRIPAAYAGVVGLKPTFQVIPNQQRWRAGPTRSHNGVLTRTVHDAHLAMTVLAPTYAGSAPRSGHGRDDLSGVTVGFVLPEGENGDQVRRTAAALRDLGCRVEETAFPACAPPRGLLAPGVATYSGDHYAAAEDLIPDFWNRHGGDLTSYARPIYEAGRRALAWQYRSALNDVARYVAEIKPWADRFDYIVTEVAPPAPTIPHEEDIVAGSPFQHINVWNHTQNPAVAVPAFTPRSAPPSAVQIVGRHHDDHGLLRLAGLLEELDPWPQRWPPTSAARINGPDSAALEHS